MPSMPEGPPDGRRPFTEAERQRIVKLFKEGRSGERISVCEIGRIMGRSRQHVSKVLNAAGCKTGQFVKRKKPQRRLTQGYASGKVLEPQQIMDAFGDD